jgi:hypothetical protein
LCLPSPCGGFGSVYWGTFVTPAAFLQSSCSVSYGGPMSISWQMPGCLFYGFFQSGLNGVYCGSILAGPHYGPHFF